MALPVEKQTELSLPDYVKLLNSGRRSELISHLKQDLRQHHTELKTLNREEARKLVHAQSDYIDRTVTLFYRLGESLLDTEDKEKGLNVSVVAAGGYGRRELCPYSDIDLLFLYEGSIDNHIIKLVNETLYFLWDMGFQVGHSCRSIKQNLKLARSDLTVCTSLIESRHIMGDKNIYESFYNKLLSQVRKQGDTFVREKIREQSKRHTLYENSVNLLEPNIKESPGGLRDYNLCLWAATVRYGRTGLDRLGDLDIFSSNELVDFINSVDFLLKVRNHLHFYCSRRSDILAMDYQDPVAKALGYENKDTKSASQQLMQDYYIHANRIRYLSRIFLPHCLKADNKTRPSSSRGGKIDVGDRFFALDGELVLAEGEKNPFKADPRLMMRVFKWCGEYKITLSTGVKRLIQKELDMVDGDFQASAEVRDIFLSVLNSKDSSQILRQMHEVHFLGRYIPEFAPLTCLAQRDLYHQFTVDEHTLKAIGHLEELSSSAEMTELASLYNGLENPALVKLALLFHDLGKGGAEDHVAGSMEHTKRILARMKIAPDMQKTLLFLVEKHLQMNYLAQHHDLDDTHTIRSFAEKIGTPQYLKMLYLVSYADIRSVGHDVWNDWKGLLLSDLYHRTLGSLEKKAPIDLKQEVLASLPPEIDRGEAEVYFDSLPDRYHDFSSAERAIKHLKLIARSRSEPIQITYDIDVNFTELMVCTANRRGVLAQIAGVLASQNINILGAQVNTLKNGIAIDTLQITGADCKPVKDRTVLKGIERGLSLVLQGKEDINSLNPSRARFLVLKKEAALPVSTRISIDNEFSPHYSVIQLVCRDRLGLLYDIASTLSGMGIDISMAKITTEAHRAIDTFYATEKDQAQITDRYRQELVKKKLMEIIVRPEK